MRVLIAHPGPGYSVADVFEGWREALSNLGCQVYVFNFDERMCFYDNAFLLKDDGEFHKALTNEDAAKLAMNGLAAGLFKIRPQLLISVFSLFNDLQTIDMARRYGTKMVWLHTESPYEDGRQLELACHADLNLINDPTNLERFREITPAEYVPHSYRPSVHYPPVEDRDGPDLFWAGTAFPSRQEFFEQMDLEGLDVALAGNWTCLLGQEEKSPIEKYLVAPVSDYTKEINHDGWYRSPGDCMKNEITAEAYRSAKCGINLYRREAEEAHMGTGWSCGPREIEMAACELFFLRDPRPESDELFPMLPTFTTPEDASEKLRWWLKRDAEREKLAGQARAAIEDRTFDKQASMMLRKLGF